MGSDTIDNYLKMTLKLQKYEFPDSKETESDSMGFSINKFKILFINDLHTHAQYIHHDTIKTIRAFVPSLCNCTDKKALN